MREQVLQSPDMILNPYRFAASGNGLLTGLVNWWDGSETSGDLIASAGSNLTATGSPSYVTDAPDSGNARSFSGSGQYFSGSGVLTSANHPSGVTIALWARSALDGTNDYIFGHAAPNGTSSLYLTAGGLPYVIFDGVASANNSTSVPAGWVSYIATSTGSNGTDELYINGVAVDSGAKTRGFEAGTATFFLGTFGAANSGTRWKGDMCSVGVWDYPFTGSQAVAFHNSGVNLRHADLTA